MIFFQTAEGGGGEQVWTSLWIEHLKGRVSTDWDWMDASPQAERCTYFREDVVLSHIQN